MNGKITVQVEVNNMPENVHGPWMVVRDCRDARFWYFGTYDTEEKAREVAEDIGNGIVLEYGG